MKITCVADNLTHEIRHFEFIRPNGILITSFFQVVRKPDIGVGCFDVYEDAVDLINRRPALDDSKNIIPFIKFKIITFEPIDASFIP